MKKKNKKTLILTLSIAALAVAGGVGLAIGLANSNLAEEVVDPIQGDDDGGLDSKPADSNGATIKKLSSGTDADGKEYVTYQYYFDPVNTTYRNVEVSMTWIDDDGTSSDLTSYYFTTYLDQDSETITVTKLKDFKRVAILTVSSKTNPDLYCTVEFHCERRFNGFNEQYTEFYQAGTTQGLDASYCANDLKSGVADTVFNMVSRGYSNTYTDDNLDKTVTITGSWTYKAFAYYESPSDDYGNVESTHKSITMTDTLANFGKYYDKSITFDEIVSIINEDIRAMTYKEIAELTEFHAIEIGLSSDQVTVSACGQSHTLKTYVNVRFDMSLFNLTVAVNGVSLDGANSYNF